MATRRAEVVVGSRKANLIINKIHTKGKEQKGRDSRLRFGVI